jgi:DNA polymerase sigma
MNPTQTEHNMRADVVYRIKQIIVSKWPEAQVEVFGSYRTGLYLPTSDIDLVVIGNYRISNFVPLCCHAECHVGACVPGPAPGD